MVQLKAIWSAKHTDKLWLFLFQIRRSGDGLIFIMGIAKPGKALYPNMLAQKVFCSTNAIENIVSDTKTATGDGPLLAADWDWD